MPHRVDGSLEAQMFNPLARFREWLKSLEEDWDPPHLPAYEDPTDTEK